MPAIEDKLKSFDKIINDDAIHARNLIRAELRNDSDQRMAGVKVDIDREAENEYQKEARRAVLEKDSRISKAGIRVRKMLMQARQHIIESILYEMTEELALYTQTDAYGEYLLKNATEALRCAGAAPAPSGATPGPSGSSFQNERSSPYRSEGGTALGVSDDYEDVRLYLTPRDYRAYSTEVQKLAPGMAVLPGGAGMIGGVRVENTHLGLFVDNTFKKKVEMCVDDLFLISGLIIDR